MGIARNAHVQYLCSVHAVPTQCINMPQRRLPVGDRQWHWKPGQWHWKCDALLIRKQCNIPFLIASFLKVAINKGFLTATTNDKAPKLLEVSPANSLQHLVALLAWPAIYSICNSKTRKSMSHVKLLVRSFLQKWTSTEIVLIATEASPYRGFTHPAVCPGSFLTSTR